MKILKLLAISCMSAAIVAVTVFAFGGNNFLYDWWQLHNYSPPSSIATLVSDTTMTPYAKKMFYLNHPELDGSEEFNKQCPAGGEKTIVLGCYHSKQAGIFLYHVNDKELYGVEQVTAAHEMLHAAYDRLGKGDKDEVDAMLQKYYDNDLHDPKVQAEIADYKISEPNDVVNEMHSIFATEITDLPGPLDAYYQRYFTDRSKVTGFANNYRSAFTKREAVIKNYDTQLKSLKSTINSDESELQTDLSQIHDRQAQLDAERASGDNVAYNSGVPGYNDLVSRYNSLVDDLRSQIARYNVIVAKRNAIALQENQLARELNSNAQPISQ
ncbi:MAG TPA: hypothetical protein VLG47_04065 [Candidatus Saccharimonadales bacterium]|nr:hypothetical protein [Candidatus Saccharimonadales bacterium]